MDDSKKISKRYTLVYDTKTRRLKRVYEMPVNGYRIKSYLYRDNIYMHKHTMFEVEEKVRVVIDERSNRQLDERVV